MTSRFAEFVEKAGQAYREAMKMAEDKKLKVCDPLRLGVELNLSVFYYEIKNDTKEAISVAQKTYSKIEEQLQHLQKEEDEYNDAATIMQILYENLKIWTGELNDEQAGRKDKNDY